MPSAGSPAGTWARSSWPRSCGQSARPTPWERSRTQCPSRSRTCSRSRSPRSSISHLALPTTPPYFLSNMVNNHCSHNHAPPSNKSQARKPNPSPLPPSYRRKPAPRTPIRGLSRTPIRGLYPVPPPALHPRPSSPSMFQSSQSLPSRGSPQIPPPPSFPRPRESIPGKARHHDQGSSLSRRPSNQVGNLGDAPTAEGDTQGPRSAP